LSRSSRIIEDLEQVRALGVITGYARDTYPGSGEVRWIIDSPAHPRIMYMSSDEVSAYCKGAIQATETRKVILR